MKKVTLLLLSLTLSTSLFIGCGSNNSSSTDANKPSTSQEETSEDKDKAEVPVSKDISIEEAKKLINDGDVTLILDVRTEKEFNEGHLKNAIDIPVEDLKENLDSIEKFKDQMVLVYCRSGKRSAEAIDILKNAGFTNLVHMNEGISAWDGETEK